jgi:hypothetical protein
MGNPKVTPNPTPVTLESKFVGTLDGQDATGGITVSIRAGGGPTGSGVVGLLPKTITLDGSTGLIHAGGFGAGGLIEIADGKGIHTIRLAGDGASGWFGSAGRAGDVLVFSDKAKSYTSPGDAAIWIKGSTGDIILQNGDCAEEFEVQNGEGIEPGAVLTLTDQGKLTLANRPYDRKVAGVVSGAGGLRPGIVLGRSAETQNRWPIALSGKAFCKVDADRAPVAVGDLLTTSPTLGHAMAARNHRRAFGAVIGKALASLQSGQALVPVLIALQ